MGLAGVMTMADERKPQDQPQDEVKKAEERATELSEDELDNIAAGGTTGYDTLDGERFALTFRKIE
jgi:hypothetical protein